MDGAGWGYWVHQFGKAHAPHLAACCWEAFAEHEAACANTNFLKGVQWAPDGSACLTASDDNWLRLFSCPQDALDSQPDATAAAAAAAAAPAAPAAAAWRPGVGVHVGETVYDCCWFPGMAAGDPVSCCFASTSRGQPISLWDAYSGALRASYRGYDDADEVTAAYSLAFSPEGTQLVAGYCKCLRLFDVSRPGRDCSRVVTHRKKQEGSIAGIVSCLAFNAAEPSLLASGSYSRCIGLFDVRTAEQQLLLEGHSGGITQVAFSPDGNFLYSGARRDGCIHCWDVRATGQVLYSLQRATSSTNQRIGFSIEPCGRHLATGGSDGHVRVFDLTDGHLVAAFRAADDTVNGVSFNPAAPLLATASGHRRYPLLQDSSSSSSGSSSSSDSDDVGAPRVRQRRGRKPAAASGSSAAPAAGHAGSSGCSSDGAGGGAADVRMGSYTRGGSCNALRLWRLQAEWVAAAGSGGAAGDGAAEEAAAAAAE